MKKGFYLGTIYFFLVLIYGFLSMYGSSVLGIDELYIFKNPVLTQGWGFFTKNPKDVKTEAYHNGKNIITPLTRSKNLFGIIRSNSRYSYEVGVMIRKVKNDNWKKTITDTFNGDYLKVKSAVKNPKVLGKVIVVNTERIPWAWSKYKGKLEFNKIYVKLDVYE